ncbi:hypothetical protein BDE36_0408 [Arcticibacter tournemirensis]|uniref:Uncharacterized protein n=1 Tax=Arcticibacter tournemirensis TaxID=699437 RepID=A0A5M9HKQ0_9SPHI|nr:hypothetical protein [Arcticibacter tournemirensis]KAA8485567.1 hypothetical protein F1649_03540 [Arcticibacter tournemirensis]TQM48718.1 hypothetical protein BDE36_0408 [Arcticibacter tournemirensis]
MKALSESQQRSFRSTVYVIEEKLRDMEATVTYAKANQQPGELLTLEYDLNEDEFQSFQNTAAEIRKVLRDIVKTYGLEGESVSLKHLLTTKASFIWEDVTGAPFDRLKGHGEIDESLRKRYENLFKQLEILTDKLI